MLSTGVMRGTATAGIYRSFVLLITARTISVLGSAYAPATLTFGARL